MWTLLGRLEAIMNTVAALLILGIMMLISVDVIGRALFSYPLYGVPEITKFSIVCMVWLQMAYTLRRRQHLRSTLIFLALPQIPRRIINVASHLTGAVLMGTIAYNSYPEMISAYTFGEFEGEHPVRVPVWPIWAIIILGTTTTAIEFTGQAIQNVFRDTEAYETPDQPAK